MRELIDTVVEFDAQVTNLNEDIADLSEQLNTTNDDLNGAVIDFDRIITGLKGEITGLKETLKEALKGEEIKKNGGVDQLSNMQNLYAVNCIYGGKVDKIRCQTANGDDEWWRLSFSKDAVISQIVIYFEVRSVYMGRRVCIMDTEGNTV